MATRSVLVSVRPAAQCRCVPVNSNVMRRLAEMQVTSHAPAVAGKPRPSLASLAVHVRAACVRFGSRTTAALCSVPGQRPSEAVCLARGLGRRVRSLACLSGQSAPCLHRGVLLDGRASITSPRPLATPLHNRSVEADTQQLGAARRVGNRAPCGAKPLCAAHLQR